MVLLFTGSAFAQAADFREFLRNAILSATGRGQQIDARWNTFLNLSDAELTQMVEARRGQLLGKHYQPGSISFTPQDDRAVEAFRLSKYANLARRVEANAPVDLVEHVDYWIWLSSADDQLASYLREKHQEYGDKILRGESEH